MGESRCVPHFFLTNARGARVGKHFYRGRRTARAAAVRLMLADKRLSILVYRCTEDGRFLSYSSADTAAVHQRFRKRKGDDTDGE